MKVARPLLLRCRCAFRVIWFPSPASKPTRRTLPCCGGHSKALALNSDEAALGSMHTIPVVYMGQCFWVCSPAGRGGYTRKRRPWRCCTCVTNNHGTGGTQPKPHLHPPAPTYLPERRRTGCKGIRTRIACAGCIGASSISWGILFVFLWFNFSLFFNVAHKLCYTCAYRKADAPAKSERQSQGRRQGKKAL